MSRRVIVTAPYDPPRAGVGIVLPAGSSRARVACADCGRPTPPSGLRYTMRGDNPRARVCVKCKGCAA